MFLNNTKQYPKELLFFLCSLLMSRECKKELKLGQNCQQKIYTTYRILSTKENCFKIPGDITKNDYKHTFLCSG